MSTKEEIPAIKEVTETAVRKEQEVLLDIHGVRVDIKAYKKIIPDDDDYSWVTTII